MTTKGLEEQYVEFLTAYGLKPRLVPADVAQRDALMRERIIAAVRGTHGDRVARVWAAKLREKQQRELGRLAPWNELINRSAGELESTIRASARYGKKWNHDVFVGEFPSGSINAQVVAVEGGFLVLVDSGLIVATSQVGDLLTQLYEDEEVRLSDAATIEHMVAVFLAYLRFGDPFLGPTVPIERKFASIVPPGILGHAARKFVIAHEYAHIGEGHLDDDSAVTTELVTHAGTIDVAKKTREQEFEADSIAQCLLLEIEDTTEMAALGERLVRMVDTDEIMIATAQMAAIAAPFLVLMIDFILADARSRVEQAAPDDSSHPDALLRMDRLWPSVEGLPRVCQTYLPSFLFKNAKEISAKLAEALVQAAGQRAGDWAAVTRPDTAELEKVLAALDQMGATSGHAAVAAEALAKASRSALFAEMLELVSDPNASVLAQTMLVGQFMQPCKGRRLASEIRGATSVFWVHDME